MRKARTTSRHQIERSRHLALPDTDFRQHIPLDFPADAQVRDDCYDGGRANALKPFPLPGRAFCFLKR
jgi:hypothetical protein